MSNSKCLIQTDGHDNLMMKLKLLINIKENKLHEQDISLNP